MLYNKDIISRKLLITQYLLIRQEAIGEVEKNQHIS